MNTKGAPEELLGAASSRLNNLESILHSSLLGLLITTTLGVVVALYKPGVGGANKIIEPVPLMIVVSALYFFLSGYYYYILVHFIGTAMTCFRLMERPGDSGSTSSLCSTYLKTLWEYFELSELPFGVRIHPTRILLLWIPALFPIVFSCVSVIGVWFFVRGEMATVPRQWLVLVCALLAQFGIFCMIVYSPWHKWVTELTSRLKPDTSGSPDTEDAHTP